MNVTLRKVMLKDKTVLWKLLQFALYDSSFYLENVLDKEATYKYRWFENYFTDSNRDAYIIEDDKQDILGFTMINSNLQLPHDTKAQSVAEFLVLPQYRKQHIGKQVAFMLWDMYQGEWEVEPMKGNEGAYKFWEKIIKEYSECNYIKYKLDNSQDIFVFKSRK